MASVNSPAQRRSLGMASLISLLIVAGHCVWSAERPQWHIAAEQASCCTFGQHCLYLWVCHAAELLWALDGHHQLQQSGQLAVEPTLQATAAGAACNWVVRCQRSSLSCKMVFRLLDTALQGSLRL